jgi:thiol-disulfide isomerase/thioredoxin
MAAIMLPAGSSSAQQVATNSYKKTLAGGIAIELVALSHPNSEMLKFRRNHPTTTSVAPSQVPAYWWMPDGNHIEHPAFQRQITTGGSAHYELVVRVVGSRDYDITATSDLTGSELASANPVMNSDRKTIEDMRCLHISGLERALRMSSLKPGEEKATIRISLATSRWEDLLVWNELWDRINPKTSHYLFDVGAWLDWPRQRGADIELEAVHTYTDSPVRLLALDRENREHIAMAEPAGGGSGLSRVIFRFKGLKLGELDTLKLQKRPFNQHADFPRVVLLPDELRPFFYWTELKGLFGGPAPEFRSIKGWKNGGPVKLADLHGKVVLLDFWNWACGPCVAAMPKLAELHEQYKDRGLVVIAVHADMADSIEDMDRKLAQARRKFWGGRDLPFLVALDGSGKTPIPGLGIDTSGATTAAFRVSGFPTTVLIDKRGNLVCEIEISRPEATRREIERLLGLE